MSRGPDKPDQDVVLIPWYRNERVLWNSMTLLTLVRILCGVAIVAVLAFSWVVYELDKLSVSQHQVRYAVCTLIKDEARDLRGHPVLKPLIETYHCTIEPPK